MGAEAVLDASRSNDASKRGRRSPAQQVRRIDRAERVINFIELLTVPSGRGKGTPFKLRPWQKDFIYDVYAPYSPVTGYRLVRRAILSIARKNGKTALIAALALVHLIGPEAEDNGEIYSAANDRDQAAQVFKVAKQIVEFDPELRQMVNVVPSTKTIACHRNGSFYRALSSEAGTKHGMNPTVVIFDELAQLRNRELYDVLDTSFGARDEPLFVVISTQSNDPEHILSKLIDDALSGADPTIMCHLYEVAEDVVDIFNEDVWYDANPALDDFRSLEDLRSTAAKAQRMPAEEPKFRNLFLNQRVSAQSSLISRAEWFACERPGVTIPLGAKVYLALDLSNTVDLSALMMLSYDDPSIVVPFFWKPDDLLSEHSFRDFGTGSRRYIDWKESGHLLTTAGRTIDKSAIALKIIELWKSYSVMGMAYDRWRIDDLMREFDRLGFVTHKDGDDHKDGLRLVPWGQGYRDMAPAIDALETEIIDKKFQHPANPVLTWNVANAVATMDPAGNRKIDKAKVRFRIDGAVALAMAEGLKARDRMQPTLDIGALIG